MIQAYWSGEGAALMTKDGEDSWLAGPTTELKEKKDSMINLYIKLKVSSFFRSIIRERSQKDCSWTLTTFPLG